MSRLLLVILAIAGLHAADGAGAYRDGPTLRLDGMGDETLLEKLRRLDREVSAARETMAQREKEVAALERENGLLRERGRDLTGRLELLEHARVSLEQARQEVADRGRRLESLDTRLTASERSRLLAERYTFDLAAEILALQPGDSQKLIDIQSRLRAMVAQQQPVATEAAK